MLFSISDDVITLTWIELNWEMVCAKLVIFGDGSHPSKHRHGYNILFLQ